MDILEPNMYIRTNDGYINKIKKVNQYNILVDARDLFGEELNIPNNEIIKASHNIIDLIEEGDIVVSLNCANILEYNLMTLSNIDELKDLWNIQKNIKSILTKEQFESMSYKVQD